MNKIFLPLAALVLGFTAMAREDIGTTSGKTTRSNKTVEELCQPSRAQSDLNINNVRTTILGGGDMWWDLNTARYEVPKGSNRHSMFAGSLWLGGLDEGNQLKLAAMVYRSRGNDFWPGPLSTDGLASVTKDVCDKYDRHWIITREQVELHRGWLFCKNDPDCDVGTKFPGYEGSIPDIVKFWPAHGVDAELPYTLAPFIDLDGDGRYDYNEDYPAYDLDRAYDCRQKETDVLYGDQTIWWVYNDRGNVHTETNAGAMGFEIRAQAFAFATNDEINNMTFNNYRIINKSTFRLTNTYFSTWFDADLGNYLDDIIGSDIPRGLGFVYNADIDDEGPIGYGVNPPAIGFDFFQGPFADYFDGRDNDRDGCIDGVRDDNGVCVPENPVTGVNERIIMSGFMYYNNTGSNFSGNPSNAAEFYNYMQTRWRNGNPVVVETPCGPGCTGNGDGFTPDGTGLATLFAYPGNSYDTTGVTAPITPQNWFESPDNRQDKRGLHNAGPFSLAPGALNFITTGAVWARNTNDPGPLFSVERVIIADDKAQSLFDNCFQILNGPDAPDIDIQELDRSVVLMLSYREGSNNDGLDYQEIDPLIQAADNTYKFEGFQIYQLKNANVSMADRYDPSQARLIAQSDLKNGVGRLINWELNTDLELLVPQDMTVKVGNDGIKMTYHVTEDAFATGTDRRLVNHREYYFSVVAYSHNEFEKFDQVLTPGGQRRPFLSGRNNVKKYTGIPHQVSAESNGTIQRAKYGDAPIITRIEGMGNGGTNLEISEDSENEIVTNFRLDNLVYQAGNGPVNIKVVDPLAVKAGNYTMIFSGISNNSTWRIEDENQDIVATSSRSISFLAEQIVPELGISIDLRNQIAPGNDIDNARNNGILGSEVVYTDATKPWLTGVVDDASYSPSNWLLCGNNAVTTLPGSLYKDFPGDDKSRFATIVGGTWGPFAYASFLSRRPGSLNHLGMGPADSTMNAFTSRMSPAELHSVDIVFTDDRSKWTRVPVFEMGEDPALTAGGTGKWRLRSDLGWDLVNGELVRSTVTTGWSWFPGYAIDLETGTRLNIAFGENSWMIADRGNDMLFNPTSRVNSRIPDPVTSGYRFGGQHNLYILGPYLQQGLSRTPMDYAGPDEANHPLFNDFKNMGNILSRTRVAKSIMWTSIPLMENRFEGANLYEPTTSPNGLPSFTRVKIRMARPYERYVTDNSNTGNPKYLFSTANAATVTGDSATAKNALSTVRVVPNPYFSLSQYETSQNENRVKITNLPPRCTMSIYTTEGALVRTLRKDNSDTWIYWDLTNNYQVPIASGVYLIHIDAPGIGQTIVKWFGTMRPFNPTGF